MINRYLFTIIAIVLIKSMGFCQQSSVINSSTLDLIDNKEVLLNRFSFNPSHLTDSDKILVDFFLHEQWIVSTESNNGFFFKAETGLLPENFSVGLLIDFKNFGLFEHRSIIGGLKKGISSGSNSSFDIGLNIGFSQSGIDKSGLTPSQPNPLIDGETEWSGSPVLDFGVAYNFRNQKIGMSYRNLVDPRIELQSTDYKLRQKGLIADYQGTFSLSDKISFIPGIYGCFFSSDSYAIIVGKIGFKNYLSAGLLYNSTNSYGFLISGTLIKRIKIGYFYDSGTKKANNNQSIGSHGLNLGIILK